MALEDFYKNAARAGHFIATLPVRASKPLMQKIGNGSLQAIMTGDSTFTRLVTHGPGLIVSFIVDAYINYREFQFEEERQRTFYAPEIAAQLHKRPGSVTTEDLDTISQNNPIIADGIKRNKTARWLSFGASALGATIALTAAVLLIGSIGALSWAVAPVGFLSMAGAVCVNGAIGLPIFFAVASAMEKVGKMVLGLSEPTLGEASDSPELQQKLSVSSQVQLLEQLQSHRQKIYQDQVMTLFIATNPALGQQIEARYGKAFNALSGDEKTNVMQQMDAQLGISQLTSDLNNRLIRAQELSFAACGQSSGVPKQESPHLNAMERAQAELAVARQKINDLTVQAKEHASGFGGKVQEKAKEVMENVKEKLGFNKSEVSAAVPGNQEKAQEELKENEKPLGEKKWAESDNIPKPTPGESHAKQVIERKQAPNGAYYAVPGRA